MLHELYKLETTVLEGYRSFNFTQGDIIVLSMISFVSFIWLALIVFSALTYFANVTLSSFYFDITKDSLYADSEHSRTRQNVIFVLQKVGFWLLIL